MKKEKNIIELVLELEKINARIAEINRPNSEYIARKVDEIWNTPERKKEFEEQRARNIKAINEIMATL